MSAPDLQALFEKARALDGSARLRFFAELRADDPESADFLEALLAGAASDGVSPVSGALEGAVSFAEHILERLERRRVSEIRYQVEDEVARGGQWAVLRVWDEDLRRRLAMKVILGRPQAGTKTAAAARSLRRFLEEAQVTGQLDHPGIVPVHELGLDAEGRVYFTMKLVEGQDLRRVFELVREGGEGWTRTRALGVMLKVCDAMAYAHSKGVIHRDLKPANVMVGKFGEVYVMDWGLARVLADEERHDLRIRPEPAGAEDAGEVTAEDAPLVTMDGDVVGTPCYMSPEQARGDLVVMGPQSDVYAAGAMLYHLLAGHPPYLLPGRRPTHFAVLRQVQEGPPRSLAKEAADAPGELVAICEKAMQRLPSRRYHEMSELAEDLRAFLEGRVVGAYETGAVAELRKWVQRNRPLAVAIGVAFAILVGGLGAVSAFQAREARLTEEKLELAQRDQQLSSLRLLQSLRFEAEDLWPAYGPRAIERYRRWLDEARGLVDKLDAGVFAASAGAGHSDALQDLLEGIADLRTPDGLIHGDMTPIGWGIERRLRFAETIENQTCSGPDARARWRVAREAIAAHPAYGGLDLAPQLGLLPIGPDPDSGLWEFWYVQSGDEPRRDDAGRIVRDAGMGIVFVLLPAGEFLMGSQKTDSRGPNYDPDGTEDEGPLNRVRLSPFFFSKYEMTQGQWERFTGTNPSTYDLASRSRSKVADTSLPLDLPHPVENVSWFDCERIMRRLGLTLPTEAQWEYAARAGTTTVRWPGDAPELLKDTANVADAFAATLGHSFNCEKWSDGHFMQAPIGSFRANAFGLHDVHGNVWEWCLDGWDPNVYARPQPRIDPLVDPTQAEHRVARGGDYGDSARLVRSAERGDDSPAFRSARTGLRPARAIDG